MNYCSNCGHVVVLKILEEDHLPRFVCESCETIHYQNPKVVTGCLPVWKDQVLLCKRAIEPRKGYWNVAGGYLENGESVEDGAKRELWEEAFAKVENVNLHTLYDIPQINQVYLHFLGDLESLDFAPGVESMEVALFTEAKIPWDQIAFTSSTFSLQCYFEDRRKEQRQLHRQVYRR